MPRLEILRESPPALARCKAQQCQKTIEWVRSVKTGRKLPVDAPLVVDAEYERLDGSRVILIDSAAAHFRSCPSAASFRRARMPER